MYIVVVWAAGQKGIDDPGRRLSSGVLPRGKCVAHTLNAERIYRMYRVVCKRQLYGDCNNIS